MPHIARGTRGLTLVEWLLAVAIVASGSAVLLGFLRQEMDFAETSSIQGDVRSRTQMALGVVSRDLRQGTRGGMGAPNAAIPAAPNNTSLTVYLPADLNGDGRIIDATGNIEWDTVNPILYQYDGGAQELQRTAEGVTRVVAHHVTAATFEDETIDAALSADEVRINLTIQETTPHRRTVTDTAAAVVRLRN